MAIRKTATWNASKDLARAICHERAERRKWLGRMILAPLLMMAAGLWLFDGWLWQSPWRAAAWWGACAILTFIVILFALFDALVAIREERAKIRANVDDR